MNMMFLPSMLSPWMCVAIAMLPPMIVALVVLATAKATSDGQWKPPSVLIDMIRITLAFLVVFSTNSLWNQAASVHHQASELALSALRISNFVKTTIPAESATAENQLQLLMEALPDQVTEQSLASAANSAAAVSEFASWAQSLPLSSDDQVVMEAFVKALDGQWFDWVVALNTPGIPLVVLFIILPLGMVYAGVVVGLPLDPAVGRRRFTWMIYFNVVVVGLVQIPLWILSTRRYLYGLDASVFADITGRMPSAASSVAGYLFAVLSVAVFYVVLVPLAKRRWNKALAAAGSESVGAQPSG